MTITDRMKQNSGIRKNNKQLNFHGSYALAPAITSESFSASWLSRIPESIESNIPIVFHYTPSFYMIFAGTHIQTVFIYLGHMMVLFSEQLIDMQYQPMPTGGTITQFERCLNLILFLCTEVYIRFIGCRCAAVCIRYSSCGAGLYYWLGRENIFTAGGSRYSFHCNLNIKVIHTACYYMRDVLHRVDIQISYLFSRRCGLAGQKEKYEKKSTCHMTQRLGWGEVVALFLAGIRNPVKYGGERSIKG